MSLRIALCGMLCAVFCSTPVFGELIVDGDLSDWGAVVADNNSSVFTLGRDFGLISWMEEDQNDGNGDGGYLGPNHGGQNYDAELMAAALQGNSLFISIVTGQRPDNGLARYSPGDILIETNAGTYGLEVGGGVGGGLGTLLEEGAPGSTYLLNNSGYTTSHQDADPQQVTGSIWSDVDWLLDPINPKVPVQFEIDDGSAMLGMSDYAYTRDSQTAQHAVIELSFDTRMFAGQTIETVEWRPACGNDELDLAVNVTPEPSSLGLLAAGGAALMSRRARQGK